MLWRNRMCWFPSYVWTASLWVGPLFWFGSCWKWLRSWTYESCTVVLSNAFMPSTEPWMFTRSRVTLVAHTPSRQGLGWSGTTLESSTLALAPSTIHRAAELHRWAPPRKIEFLIVTPLAVTLA